MSQTPSARTLLARADLLLLLAGLLRKPEQVALPETTDIVQMLRAAALVEDDRAAAVEELVEQARQTPRDVWREEYHRLFEGAIACPVNEAAYIRRDKGALLADIGGFYRAFGLQHSAETGERLDHLRCELEFIAMLLYLLARAKEQANEEHETVTLDAMRRFVGDHLGEWFPSFCAHLRGATTQELFGRWADVAEGVFEELASLLTLPVMKGREPIPPRLEDPDGSTECAVGPTATPCALTIEGR